MHSIGPVGERQGWQRIKKRLERFLTMHSIGPVGERQGWQRIKKRLERFTTIKKGRNGDLFY
jgi:hypothetical protein